MREPDGSVSSGRFAAAAILQRRGVAFLIIGRLLPVLLLMVLTLLFLLNNQLAAAFCVLALLALAYCGVWMTERYCRNRLSLTKKELRALEYQALFGPAACNGLFVPLICRVLPFAAALGALLLFYFTVDTSLLSAEIRLTGVFACLCAPLSFGTTVAVPLAAVRLSVILRRYDIAVEDFTSMGSLARTGIVLADQSVFHGTRNAELRGFYTGGALYPITDLDFDRHMPLVIGLSKCDDGSLSAAYGFRQNFTDVLLRAMRTTVLEHRENFTLHTDAYLPYRAETGTASVSFTTISGAEYTYTAGRPERMLPLLMRIHDDHHIRTVTPADLRRIQVVLRQMYDIGRQAVLLASGTAESGFAFVGLVFISSVPLNDADTAVAALKADRVPLVYVTDENEHCAFYRSTALGVTGDIGQVLTGTRMEHFRPENVKKAALQARLTADMSDAQRARYAELMQETYTNVLAVSRREDDPLFTHADLVMTESRSAPDGVALSARNCRITDVPLMLRTARALCDTARRAMLYMQSIPLLIALFLLVSVWFAPYLPFSAPAVLFLLLSLLFVPGYLIASGGRDRPTADPFQRGNAAPPPRVSGAGYTVWVYGAMIFSAVYAASLFSSLSPVAQAGIPAAAAVSFLTLLTAAVAAAMTACVWGESVFLTIGRGYRSIAVFSVVLLAAAYGLLRFEPVCAFFRFGVVPYRHLPATVVPAVLLLFIYECGRLLVLRLRRPKKEAAA